jgi:hypothetical protein
VGLVDLGAEAEVGCEVWVSGPVLVLGRDIGGLTKFDIAFHREEDIVGLDVTMYDAFRMQMLQAL